jgi:DNA-binding transcriptional ArsR family regulator
MPKPSTPAARRKRATPRRQEHAVDEEFIKAMAHPTRMRILGRLNEVVASPKELALEFGIPLPQLSYHVRLLADMGFLELVRQEQRRGAMEHYYRALRRAYLSDSEWKTLPANLRQGISASVLKPALGDVRAALTSGSFDERDDRHLTYTPLSLDEQGWKELGELLLEVVDRAMEIQAESAGRLQDDEAGGAEVLSRLTVLHYAAPTDK